MIDNGFSADEVRSLADLHRKAFPEFFLSRLGEPFLRQFYLGFISDPEAVVSVARAHDGTVIGVCVGTTNPSGFFSRLLKRRFLGFLGASLLVVLRTPRAVPRLLGGLTYRGDVPAGLGGALLSSLCVDPAIQSRGVGWRLEEAWRERASELGASSAFLTTDADGNDSVNRFYQRSGWTLTDAFVTRQGRLMNRYRCELTLDGRNGLDQR